MTITPQMENEVADIRANVRQALHEAQARARASDKPLLIMVAEHHYGATQLLLESIIYQEARALGVKDVAFELPRDNPRLDPSVPMMEREFIPSQLGIYKQLLYYADRAHLIDDCHGTGDDNARNENMAANLNPLSSPTLFLTGGNHFKAIEALMAQYASHEVLSFDITTPPNVLYGKGSKRTPSYMGTVPAFAHREHLWLSFDANALLVDEVLQLGMDTKEAASFIPWAESHGHKRTRAMAEKEMAGFEKAQASGKSVASHYRSHAIALYEVGRDAEAGKFYAYAVRDGNIPAEGYSSGDAKKEMEMFDSARFSTTFMAAYTKQMAEFQQAKKIPESHLGQLPVPPSPVKDSSALRKR